MYYLQTIISKFKACIAQLVKADYDNNTTQTLTSNLQWIITNPEIVSIQNNTLKALKEGETTIKARYKNLTSQSLHVSVYKVINGHDYRLR